MDDIPISKADAAKAVRLSDQVWKAVEAARMGEPYFRSSGPMGAIQEAMGFADHSWIMAHVGGSGAVQHLSDIATSQWSVFDNAQFQSTFDSSAIANSTVFDQAFEKMALPLDTSSWFAHATNALTAVKPQVWESVIAPLLEKSAIQELSDSYFGNLTSPSLTAVSDLYAQMAGHSPAMSTLVDTVRRSVFTDLDIPSDITSLGYAAAKVPGLGIELPASGTIDRILELLREGVFDTNEFDEFYDEAMESLGWRSAIRTAGSWIAAKGKVSREVGNKAAVVLLWVTVWSVLYVLYMLPPVSAALSSSGISTPQVMDKLQEMKERRRTRNKDEPDNDRTSP